MARKKEEELVVVRGTSSAISFETEGQSVTGNFERMEKGVGKNESNLYHFSDGNKEFSIWGSANLDPILAVAKKGDRIRVTYKGKKKTNQGFKVKIFEVAGTPSFSARAEKVINDRIANSGKKERKSRKS